ncbi:MAG: hypothetical protein ACK5RL_00285 [Acidimicrobiales bacterium]
MCDDRAVPTTGDRTAPRPAPDPSGDPADALPPNNAIPPDDVPPDGVPPDELPPDELPPDAGGCRPIGAAVADLQDELRRSLAHADQVLIGAEIRLRQTLAAGLTDLADDVGPRLTAIGMRTVAVTALIQLVQTVVVVAVIVAMS